jgi:hypothetical protein
MEKTYRWIYDQIVAKRATVPVAELVAAPLG